MWPFGHSSSSAGMGARGERIARDFLKRQGLKVLAANYRCPVGEADLIALDSSTRRDDGAETLCIVEVKTRNSDKYTDPESAVDADKRRRLKRVAEYYINHHPAEGLNVRFDVVAVVIQPAGEPQVRHIPSAF